MKRIITFLTAVLLLFVSACGKGAGNTYTVIHPKMHVAGEEQTSDPPSGGTQTEESGSVEQSSTDDQTGDSGSQTGNPDDDSDEEEQLMIYDKYDFETYTARLWQGSVVYNETVMFVGKGDKAPLLYPATEIVSVRSFDLKTEYAEGADYVYDREKNLISLTANSRIPYIPEEEYYPTEYASGSMFEYNGAAHRYIMFREGSYFASKQIAITYRHGGNAYISAPENYSEGFSAAVERKLALKDKVKVLFYGDSITVGANASGFVNYSPFAPTWAEMVFEGLTARYGFNAEYKNLAVGGWTSQNGLDNVLACMQYAPDIMFIAFGMNDGISPKQHAQTVNNIVTSVLYACPNCIVCLVSTMLPNPEVKGFSARQGEFHAEYPALISNYRNALNADAFFADVTAVHRDILTRKRYRDMTGNNVNHPNDFLSRIYAQTVLQTICG